MGAPIFLVSACASGEEFVAAFRRYADKNGLFIPIGDPLPPGGRSRFAVTLRDGGVMIEGEAEIVSSARAPSVLHGRVGMTLRFVQPDEASRTTLSELVRARLAMKPTPLSVPPRPADIPAEPRPVPPPVQGRIDAVNALAECVAIGDVSVLGPPLPAAPLPPPKAGPRFVMPAIPAGRAAPGTSPPGALGVASRPAAAPRAPTAPLPIAIPRPDDRTAAEPPAVIPRATPQPDRLRSAERTAAPDPVSGLSRTMTAIEVAPGPTSDTMVAVAPPPAATLPAEPSLLPEASGRFDRGPLSATMTAVPLPSANPPSAPTEIGGPLVALDDDDDSTRTRIHAGAPRPTPPPPGASGPAMPRAELGEAGGGDHADERSTLPPVDVAQTLRDPPLRVLEPRPAPPLPVTVHGMPHELRPPAPPLHPEIEIAEPTDISMPPVPPASPSAELPAEPAPSTEPEAAALRSGAMPSAEVVAAALLVEPAPSIEVSTEPSAELSAEPSGTRPIEPPPEDAGAPPRLSSVQIETLEIQESGAITHELSAEPGPDAAPGRPRRTVVGVAVQPTGVLIPPAPSTRRAAMPAAPLAASPAGPDEPTTILVGDPAIDAVAPTVPPGSEELSAAAPPPSEPAPAAPAAISNGLPSGDWTIALDPAAPDGWSPPRHAVPRHPLAGMPAESANADGAGDGPAAARPQRPGEMPAVEPKVQIDPTLIEPALAPPMVASPGLTGSAPELAMYAPEPGREAIEAPALHMMMAVPQPGPYAPPHASPIHGGQTPGYPLEPPYPMMPGALPPGLVPADGSGFGTVRYPPMPSQLRRRHLVIMLVTAVVAVLLGIAAMLVFRRPPPPVDPGSQVDDRPGAIETPAPGESPRVPDRPPSGAPGAPPSAAAPAGAAVTSPPETPPASSGSSAPAPAHAVAPASPTPAPPSCYADVSSVPAGAEIVLDQASVIGTTPQRVALPCGHPVELLVRKPHLVPSTHTITPTPEGTAVQFVLIRQTFLVKVSSTPPGATVTLGGKSLGVTPTMVKVPAFESSTLSIAKDGYETESETVAPRGNGTAVHSMLKKAEHKKPR